MTELYGTPEATEPVDVTAKYEHRDELVERELSIFDELKAEADKDLNKYVTYENTLRPGWYMRFLAVIEGHELKRYERHTLGTGKKRSPENADLIKGNAVMLADKCVAILKGGTDDEHIVIDPEDNEDMKLNSTAFVAAFGDKNKGTVQSAIQKFLGDAQIMKIAGSLLSEAGYDEDAQPVDPTNA
ncbi:hypothetical protein BARRETLEMON_17 [Arthrobacter phage BarretLemon]|uniref:Uncharacterized protein n=4 Tax=Marthavirus barretlemon TaxID=2560300 RepID=A0A386KLF9_9CAUD|nr:tail assembly chaperone [Arthrobacter phage BarretLemon]AMM44479.1 hypothetical protein BARRETLEMON_17 [Arthrobacter phage BarretLemon]ASR78047.1 hypothetical protein SEA_TIMINATOR_17 [Arthrobacter phage Timinator]AYD86488.1 hypothetical protein SEA_LEEROYJ_17 [Arthrobacter phage LeeroyJ]QJD53347.1 hypothetical protein SEA_STEVIEBAY_17 [Arthrobacter phage StevieBAY]